MIEIVEGMYDVYGYLEIISKINKSPSLFSRKCMDVHTHHTFQICLECIDFNL